MKYLLQMRFKVKGHWEGWMAVFGNGVEITFLEGEKVPNHYLPKDDDEEIRLIPYDMAGEVG